MKTLWLKLTVALAALAIIVILTIILLPGGDQAEKDVKSADSAGNLQEQLKTPPAAARPSPKLSKLAKARQVAAKRKEQQAAPQTQTQSLGWQSDIAASVGPAVSQSWQSDVAASAAGPAVSQSWQRTDSTPEGTRQMAWQDSLESQERSYMPRSRGSGRFYKHRKANLAARQQRQLPDGRPIRATRPPLPMPVTTDPVVSEADMTAFREKAISQMTEVYKGQEKAEVIGKAMRKQFERLQQAAIDKQLALEQQQKSQLSKPEEHDKLLMRYRQTPTDPKVKRSKMLRRRVPRKQVEKSDSK